MPSMPLTPCRKILPENGSAAGNPNDDELDPARENVTIRGADTESNDDFTASQVEISNMQDKRVSETTDREPTKAQKIVALKKQLEDLEK